MTHFMKEYNVGKYWRQVRRKIKGWQAVGRLGEEDSIDQSTPEGEGGRTV